MICKARTYPLLFILDSLSQAIAIFRMYQDLITLATLGLQCQQIGTKNCPNNFKLRIMCFWGLYKLYQDNCLHESCPLTLLF